ncbi:hypothetical protein [Thalassotalea aquiviva]|uniref:hypothetical protein n=1 Tax=Thalassotalea aquiviva TaxID=3242415 RepID=UPI00352B7755
MQAVFENNKAILSAVLKLALMSLLLANLLAVFLVLLKIPGFTPSYAQQIFKPFLVYHVNLAMLFWVPIISCWFAGYLFSLNQSRIKLSIGLSLLSFLLLFISLFDLNNQVNLNNYFPTISSPWFLGALVVQLVAISVFYSAIHWQCKQNQSAKYLFRWAVWAWWLFVASLLVNLIQLDITTASAVYFEQLIWGPGHVQQVMNALLIAACWSCYLKDSRCTQALKATAILAIFTTVLTLGIAQITDDLYLKRQVFTWQMSYFSWLPMLVVAYLLIKQRVKNLYLHCSLVLAGCGVIVGALITPGMLTVPGHYHGMTGAFNVAFFALILLAYQFNPKGKAVWLTTIYSLALLILVFGLSLAGMLGIGRKLVAQQQGVLEPMQMVAIAFVVIGAFIAIIASLLLTQRLLRNKALD